MGGWKAVAEVVASTVGENGAREGELPSGLRQIAADAWAFRWQVELEADVRFARLATRLAATGIAPTIVQMARQASEDERRHAQLCKELAVAYGHPGQTPAVSVPEIAPSLLGERQKLLYEVVAACCITETESMSVLTTLLHSARGERMLAVLREIARDEVTHSRLGWAHLAHEQGQIDVRFLGSLVPAMLEGTVGDALFAAAAAPELEDPLLLQHGVLPHSTKRSIFVQTLMEVTFPGLETFGVDTAPARQWLDQKRTAIESARQP